MKVRIEAQQKLNGTVRCQLVITESNGAEMRMPARLTVPGDEGVLAMLADGAPYAVEVDTPLLQSVTVDTSRPDIVHSVGG